MEPDEADGLESEAEGSESDAEMDEAAQIAQAKTMAAAVKAKPVEGRGLQYTHSININQSINIQCPGDQLGVNRQKFSLVNSYS